MGYRYINLIGYALASNIVDIKKPLQAEATEDGWPQGSRRHKAKQLLFV